MSEQLKAVLAKLEPGAVIADTLDQDVGEIVGLGIATSIAISLKRIADVLEGSPKSMGMIDAIFEAAARAKQ